jgi:uncharacterized protein
LLDALSGILRRNKFIKAITATGMPSDDLVEGYAALCMIVTPTQIGLTITADPSDDQVLACAIAAHADWLVSGDKHLHSLGEQFDGIKILRPAEAVRLLELS